ncbi:acetyl-CoA carboxylase biotin carboxyl carrier protein [Rubrobacter aplysinae]|uniref:acetyl-CoA carboxylase biotin carboxyl carrier protein n=1 Tax=Rubrobacter aplysinae TaxID=909625 RepID=UPI000B1FB295|nr:acetyl-CoA carboxylase biotin carboxyl carrier protein [Rubrobacter aplysinae]
MPGYAERDTRDRRARIGARGMNNVDNVDNVNNAGNGGSSGENAGDPGPESALPLEEVGRLVELVQESGVGEIRVRQGELEVTVRARETAIPEGGPPAQPAARTAAPEPAPAETEEAAGQDGLHEVRSPLVGTFYRAPAPGEDDYVQVGDRVREGQTLCIVEAMKLMNEIPADVSGEVVEVLAENTGGVQYDQPLFALQPDSE